MSGSGSHPCGGMCIIAGSGSHHLVFMWGVCIMAGSDSHITVAMKLVETLFDAITIVM